MEQGVGNKKNIQREKEKKNCNKIIDLGTIEFYFFYIGSGTAIKSIKQEKTERIKKMYFGIRINTK